jgi:hypothetical protein
VRLLLPLLLVACTKPPPLATPADAARSGIQLTVLHEGRELLVRKCGGCHAPPQPRAKLPREWPAMLDEMVERSNVDVAQRGLILQYLVTLADPAARSASAP